MPGGYPLPTRIETLFNVGEYRYNQGESTLDREFGTHILLGLVIGVLFGVFLGAITGNTLLGIGLGALGGVFVGWFATAAVSTSAVLNKSWRACWALSSSTSAFATVATSRSVLSRRAMTCPCSMVSPSSIHISITCPAVFKDRFEDSLGVNRPSTIILFSAVTTGREVATSFAAPGLPAGRQASIIACLPLWCAS